MILHERNEENPIYLAHILEHNYLVKENNNTVSLGGVVIGFALNSVHYYQKEAYGATYETKIDSKKLEAEGKKIAQEVLKRLRKMDGMKIFRLQLLYLNKKKNLLLSQGTSFPIAPIKVKILQIREWKDLNEEYYLFPSTAAEEKYRDDVNTFTNFKEDVEEYFPNFNGVIGRAFIWMINYNV